MYVWGGGKEGERREGGKATTETVWKQWTASGRPLCTCLDLPQNHHPLSCSSPLSRPLSSHYAGEKGRTNGEGKGGREGRGRRGGGDERGRREKQIVKEGKEECKVVANE